MGKIGSWEAELQSNERDLVRPTHRIFETDPSRSTHPSKVPGIHHRRTARKWMLLCSVPREAVASTVEYRSLCRMAASNRRGALQAFHDEKESRSVLRALAETSLNVCEPRRNCGAFPVSSCVCRTKSAENRNGPARLHRQDLVALATTLSQLHAAVPSSSRKLRSLLRNAKRWRSVHPEVRTLSYLLHPPMLDEAGVEDANSSLRGRLHGANWNRNRLEISPRLGRMKGRRRDGSVRVCKKVSRTSRGIQASPGKIRMDRDPERSRGSERQCSGITGDLQDRMENFPSTEWDPQHERASKAHRRQWILNPAAAAHGARERYRARTEGRGAFRSGGGRHELVRRAYGDYFALDADGESSACRNGGKRWRKQALKPGRSFVDISMPVGRLQATRQIEGAPQVPNCCAHDA